MIEAASSAASISGEVIHQFRVFGAALLAFWGRRFFPSLQLRLCIGEVNAQIAELFVTGSKLFNRLLSGGKTALGGI